MINPKLSADAFLEGQYDYNAVPFPPFGWRMLIFEGPKKMSSWGFHGVEGFSVGPAEKNYRCYTWWIPTTGSEQISDTVVFFTPLKYKYDLPALPTQEDVVQEAVKALGDSLRTLATNNPTYTHYQFFRDYNKCQTSSTQQQKRIQTARRRKDRG